MNTTQCKGCVRCVRWTQHEDSTQMTYDRVEIKYHNSASKVLLHKIWNIEVILEIYALKINNIVIFRKL